MRISLGLAFTLWCAATASAAETGPAGVTIGKHGVWTNCFILSGGDCKAVVVPNVGGRILSYTINGENVLLENPDLWNQMLRGYSNVWIGGYQCDLGPEIRTLPEHRMLLEGPWEARAPRSFTVHTFSGSEMSVGVQLDKEFVIDPDSGDLGVTQRMRNVVNNEISFCLRDQTICKGGGFALIPLNRKSRFKHGWAIRRGQAGSFSYDGEKPQDGRVRVMDGVLVAQAKGTPDAPELKLGADSDAGWIAYVSRKILFVKYFPIVSKANYSDGGNTVEFRCSEQLADLGPLSPEVKLKSAENYTFPEKWTLVELDKEVTTYEQARALVKRIPKSPFAN